jgi:hypothetical protein
MLAPRPGGKCVKDCLTSEWLNLSEDRRQFLGALIQCLHDAPVDFAERATCEHRQQGEVSPLRFEVVDDLAAIDAWPDARPVCRGLPFRNLANREARSGHAAPA